MMSMPLSRFLGLVLLNYLLISDAFQSNFLNSRWQRYRTTKKSAKNTVKLSDSHSSFTNTALSFGDDSVQHLDHIERVFCISDLHIDHKENMEWLKNRTFDGSKNDLGKNDLLVVAGDISHEIDMLEQSFAYLRERQNEVLFVPGNHEAWVATDDLKEGRNSLDKLQRVYEVCEKFGVLTGCVVVGGSMNDKQTRTNPLWIVPLESWYDGTLSIEGCEDLCEGFGSWPWVDFIRCRWPSKKFPPMTGLHNNNKIPLGLAEYFVRSNKRIIQSLEASVSAHEVSATTVKDDSPAEKSSLSSKSFGVMTVSHFLPNKQCLPDWKDLNSDVFLRDKWLDHGGGQMSAKFAKVAGTALLDEQIRLDLTLPKHFRKMHVFGHSHRPKDFEFDDIRYIHNPLGKPRERDNRMISPDVDLQVVWDTRVGEVSGEQVVRYWEEKGGGLDALKERLSRKTRSRSRYAHAHAHMKKTSGVLHRK